MSDDVNPEFAWSIVVRTMWKRDGKPYLLSHICERTREEAIKEVCSTLHMTWKQLYHRHFRAVRVKIEVVSEGEREQ